MSSYAASQILTSLEIPGLKKFASGKVREVFDLGNRLLVVATDRLSAFDCILPTGIPWKGHVLNQLSNWWFDRLGGIIPNHRISISSKDFPPSVEPLLDVLAGRSMIVKKAEAIPVECVARGYLIGSGWKEYQESCTVCGIPLPRGYRLAEKLQQPIFTPAAKAHTGHDENVSFDRVCQMVGNKLAEQLRTATLRLYTEAATYARERGIIIADTKFEFGLVDGELTLIDEVLTPDSSRFWPAASYEPGKSPPSFDKQYVRDYLESLDWNKQSPAPALPIDVQQKTSRKYLDAFQAITGAALPGA